MKLIKHASLNANRYKLWKVSPGTAGHISLLLLGIVLYKRKDTHFVHWSPDGRFP